MRGALLLQGGAGCTGWDSSGLWLLEDCGVLSALMSCQLLLCLLTSKVGHALCLLMSKVGHTSCVLECIGVWHIAQVFGAVGKCPCEYQGDCPRSVSEGLERLHELAISQLVSLFVGVLLVRHCQPEQGFQLAYEMVEVEPGATDQGLA